MIQKIGKGLICVYTSAGMVEIYRDFDMKRVAAFESPDGNRVTCASGSSQYIFLGLSDKTVGVYSFSE